MFTYIRVVGPRDLDEAMREAHGGHLVDVRSAAEFAQGHAAGAVSAPLETLDPSVLRAVLGTDAGTCKPICLVSSTGARAEHAAHRLRRHGLENVCLLDGGMGAWMAAGLPVVRRARMPSLERQGQIAVGLLLIAILAKAMLLHPVFYALLAALGVALVGIGLDRRYSISGLMARLPWNRALAIQQPGPG